MNPEYPSGNPFRKRLRAVRPVLREGWWLQTVTVNRDTSEVEAPDCEPSGGRFNPPRICAMTYLSQDTPACRARMAAWCTGSGPGLERMVLVYRIRVERLLDLCDPRTRVDAGVTRSEIVGRDLSVPRLLGVAAFREEFDGILYPRPGTRGGLNLALYRSRAAALEVSVVDRFCR